MPEYSLEPLQMTMDIIPNKSACVTRQGLGLRTYLSVVSSLAGVQEEIIVGQCRLEAFRSPRTSASRRGLTHMATMSTLHKQLPANQPAQLRDISRQQLPLGTSFRRTFLVGNTHCSPQVALSVVGRLALGSPPCKAQGGVQHVLTCH